MRPSSRILILLVLCVSCVLTGRPAGADVWTASETTKKDGLLDAQAEFTISDGKIVVTITNLLDPTEIKSAGQAVSGISFTISNAPGTNSSNSALGALVDVGSNGSTSPVTGDPGRWVGLETVTKGKNTKTLGSFGISKDTITLETIGGGQPTELILPYSKDGYSSANSSITNFNPEVDGPATFTLNLSGVTSSTKISDVQFFFGTGPDYKVVGSQAPLSTPEPSTLVLAMVGATGLLGYALRRRRG